MIRETYSSEESFELGESLGRKAVPGQIYTLTGDLGTGKTVFAQGFAKGLGVNGYVNSPTFTILQVYEDGRLPLYHFDVYRIEEPEEMEEIGYGDYFFGEGVTLIEWADIIGELIPEDAIRIEISKDLSRGMDYRRIMIETGDGSPVHDDIL
ncbi:MAG: tRNA (adenosine(37)-N6)-threonylcarbamoyltransferase complex ATPase subunit type 1 TsaE [Lachnospiraceae bacterium]|nr:tRNA (adenosine(37)-N6)-threonylcarbamoyltransferase complex ATPase subunit type 1 TsaE [Lachnospiraceae bacterium]